MDSSLCKCILAYGKTRDNASVPAICSCKKELKDAKVRLFVISRLMVVHGVWEMPGN